MYKYEDERRDEEEDYENDLLYDKRVIGDANIDVSVIQPTKKLVHSSLKDRPRAKVLENVKNDKIVTHNFWKLEGVPSEFKNYAKLLEDAIRRGDLTKTLFFVSKVNTKFTKDTSMTDYLLTLFAPHLFQAAIPTMMKTKHILVPFTQEITLSSLNAISIHWNVGMWNAANGQNIYTNVINNGSVADITPVDYVVAGINLPNYYSAMIPVAAIMTITPEGNDFNENGRIYITSTYDESVRMETPITYSNYTIPAGYVNQYYKYIGHPKRGAFAIFLPPNDRFMTYQQLANTSATSSLNGALIEALIIGSNNVPVAVTMTTVFMFKPLPLQVPFVGVNTAKPGKTPNCFDLGSIAGDYPHLITGNLSTLEDTNRIKEINEAIMNVPGIEADDFWTGLAKLGAIALNAIPSIIEGFVGK